MKLAFVFLLTFAFTAGSARDSSLAFLLRDFESIGEANTVAKYGAEFVRYRTIYQGLLQVADSNHLNVSKSRMEPADAESPDVFKKKCSKEMRKYFEATKQLDELNVVSHFMLDVYCTELLLRPRVTREELLPKIISSTLSRWQIKLPEGSMDCFDRRFQADGKLQDGGKVLYFGKNREIAVRVEKILQDAYEEKHGHAIDGLKDLVYISRKLSSQPKNE